MDDWFVACCILLIGLAIGFTLGFAFENQKVIQVVVEYCRH